MSLEKKSLTQLRSIAQSMGIVPDFADDKAQLLQKIAEYTTEKVAEPVRPVQVNINYPAESNVLTQEMIQEAVKPFQDFGLRVSFPDARTWEMHCNDKHDSGTMAMSLWSVVQCAKSVIT